jgi:hypothetical protein
VSVFIQRHTARVRSPRGEVYNVDIYGEQRAGGTWEGWLEFNPENGGPRLRTERETTQPNHDALVYWASGLEPLYLEGAFERAR